MSAPVPALASGREAHLRTLVARGLGAEAIGAAMKLTARRVEVLAALLGLALPSRLEAARAAMDRLVAPDAPPFHPLANLFPLMTGDDFTALVEDIRAQGQQQPIWLLRGEDGIDRVLDGRNRWRACSAAGIAPVTRRYTGADPLGFVLSLNLRRRHLDESQRALVAARVANLEGGRPSKTSPKDGVSVHRAASLLNVGARGVERGRAVLREGADDLIAAVERGEVPLTIATDVASLPRDEQADVVARGEREILARAKEIRAQKADARRAERLGRIAAVCANNPEFPEGCWPVIYADPPWRFDAGDSARSTENHYPTMSCAEIAALPVERVAARDAVLFLWTRNPLLLRPDFLAVISAWGFDYVSHFVWDKGVAGTGYWARAAHEICLICTRGQFPAPAPSDVAPSVIRAPRGTVSEKPEGFYDVIERYTPGLRRLELFARLTPHGKHAREGWDVWGNETGLVK